MVDRGRTRTIIFEDDGYDLRATCSILSEIPEIEVIGVYDTTATAVEQCERLRPELILVDSEIRGNKSVGPIFVRNVRKVLPKVKLLGLTKYPECIAPLKAAGCQEAILKQFFDDPEAARKYIRDTMLPRPDDFIDEAPHVLTKDKERALRMLARGDNEEEIEAKLELTRKQLRRLTDELKREFQVKSNKNTELIARAYAAGYLKPEDNLDKEV